MKIIFLDFDGVICTWNSIRSAHQYMIENKTGNNKVDSKNHNIKMIDSDLVINLNSVIEKTDAKIVVSSTWRIIHPLDELKEYLNERGFFGEIIGRTPIWKEYKHLLNGISLSSFWESERGNEIKMWLDEHSEVESFVILDDEVSDIKSVFPDNYIRTNMKNGFHKGLVQEAIYKLNKETNNG